MADRTCHVHPEAAAAESCYRCMRPICAACTASWGFQAHCTACVRRKRLGRALAGAAALLAAGGLVAAFVLAPKPKLEAPPRFLGNPLVRALITKLDQEPCHRSHALKLVNELYKEEEYREVVDRVDAFLARCGPYSRLEWPKYEALKQLSENQKAIEVATRLIEETPHDKDFWWWRGVVYERIGELDKAAADFRQAIANEPRLGGVPFNLATVLERLGRPCEAIFPIEQYLHHHPKHRTDPSVTSRLERLYASAGCGAIAGQGRAQVRFRPGGGGIFAQAKVNGRSGKFLVDTGASYVTLARPFADALDLGAGAGTVKLRTANGVVEARLATAESVELQGARAGRVAVAVVDHLEGSDGLLGLSFLSRFALEVDGSAGKLTLSARR